MKQDIRLDIGFFTHPKTLRLKRRLGDSGIVCLLRLWVFAAQNRPDGRLCGLDAEGIADACGAQCDPEQLVAALVECGFLKGKKEWIINDWEVHQPWVAGAKSRSAAAREAAKTRWGMRGACGAHADRIGGAMRSDAEGNAPSPIPSPSPTPIPKSTPSRPPADKSPPPDGDFEQFWASYPRKVGKRKAEAAWKAAKNRPPLSRILAAVEKQKAGNTEWARDGGRFIPHPTTWLNQGRWDDELTQPPPAPRKDRGMEHGEGRPSAW